MTEPTPIIPFNYTKEHLLTHCLEALDATPETWMADIYHFIVDWYNDHSFIEVKTSGSTGIPKTIRIEKSAMMQSARMTAKALGMSLPASLLLCIPAAYIGGKMMLVRALVNGWKLDALRPSGNPLLNLRTDYDLAAMTPPQVQHALENPGKTLNRINKIIIGGAAVLPQLDTALQSSQVAAWESFGMTETISHIALRKINGADKSPFFQLLPGVKGWANTDGCLHLELNLLGTIESQDQVRFVTPDTFEWLGRKDDVINSGGVKLHPAHIEKKIAKILNRRFFICGQADPLFGDRLTLVIEGQPFDTEAETALWQNLKRVLNKLEVPKNLYFMKQLEETPNGKIRRQIKR